MSARRFKFPATLMRGRREIELVVTYSMTPGYPETGPSYACGGTPAEPAEIEIISAQQNGLNFHLTEEEHGALWVEACERSGDDWADDHAAAMEYRADQRRDDLMMDHWERGE
jgi:hypothetical protein